MRVAREPALAGRRLILADLFGHSMGGAAAIVLAGLRPGAVTRLALGEPNLVSGGGLFSRPIAAQPEARYLAGGHLEAVRAARQQGDPICAAGRPPHPPLGHLRRPLAA